MEQLPQIFSRLHSSHSSWAEPESLPVNVSRRNYFKSKSGRSLYVSICNMHQYISQNPGWFERQLVPSGSSSAFVKSPPGSSGEALEPRASSGSCQPQQRVESGLMLNEVRVRTPPLKDRMGAPRKNLLLLPPSSSHSLELGPSPALCPGPALCPSPTLCPSPGLCPSAALCPSPVPPRSSVPMQRDTSR